VARKDTSVTEPVREDNRYDFAVPMEIEVATGLFRQPDRLPAYLIDLSSGGAAILAQADTALRVKKRYRVWVDGLSGIIQIRHLSPVSERQVRLGVSFSRLDLGLQELVVDAIARARIESTRIRGAAASDDARADR